MPVGILTDVAVTLTGGILGCLLGSHISEDWKKLLNTLMGIAALVMGMVLIQRADNLSPVILSLLVGGCIGQFFQIEDRINGVAQAVTNRFMGGAHADESYLAQVSTVLILFSFSGSGWYGALNEGLTGDGGILVTKAILDGVAACIFAALLGKIVLCLCLPQLCIFMILFGVSGLVRDWITPAMIADFSALGGIVTLAAGLRLSGIKRDIQGLNLLPGLIAVFFISGLWSTLLN